MITLIREIVLTLFVLALMLWGSGALWYRGPGPGPPRVALIIAWLLVNVLFWASLSWAVPAGVRSVAITLWTLTLIACGLWWRSIRPLQHRDWAEDVARLLDFEMHGDHVMLHNVRNFAWRTRADFTARWETRRYDLTTLHSVDLIASYWMGPTIAHTLVSFGFTDGRHLVFSVEVRRPKGIVFSALGGFFKQTELLLVAADERDIVHTRSNVRGEEVYLYRVGLSPAAMRELFIAYLDVAADLRRHPRFYHSVVSNCTTLVFDMVDRIVPGLPKDVRLLLSGYLPGYIYDLGALDTSRSLAELEQRGHINAQAIASDIDGHAGDAFSAAIRRGVTAPDGTLIEPDQ